MADIDYYKTADQKKLVIRGEYPLSRMYVIFVFAAALSILYYEYDEVVDDLCRKLYLFLLVPVCVFVAAWISYRVLTERTFYKISAPCPFEQQKEIVERYLTREKWDFNYISNHCLSALKSGLPDLQATILFDAGEIYTNVVYYDRVRRQMPILFAGTELRDGIYVAVRLKDNPDGELIE